MLLTKRYILVWICLTFFVAISAFSHDILFDDVNNAQSRGDWSHLIDTLENHGVTVHYLADEGWSSLTNMDMLWLIWGAWPGYDGYDDETIQMMIEFCRNGGILVLGQNSVIDYYNEIILYTGWQTTMEISESPLSHGEIIRVFWPFPPFTAEVDSFRLTGFDIISCGEYAYPFAFNDSGWAVAAISYPFAYEDNCSSFILLVTGASNWLWDPCCPTTPQNVHFASNILLAAAGVPGYELEPGAIPGGGNACAEEPDYSLCHRTPNPFTPNGDGINDEAEFTFPGLGEVPGTIKIFSLDNLRVRTIEVPSGTGAKQEAIWDGKDDTGAPMREGIYLYTIRAEGRIKCQGTVTLAR